MTKNRNTTDIQKLEALTRGQVTTNISLLQKWKEETNNPVVIALIEEILSLLNENQPAIQQVTSNQGLQELSRLVSQQYPHGKLIS